ncbi:bifunctional riboflavin kinase/FAD synthetase [Nitrosophilus alvini]|uniref:bifunctional riboflavin kinase/FAD synthetase n=1 Tax=Nitrosophilus alvini TaxID=2714855 RepID=UPI00190C998F|nr:bifunctional riboflavin kinase/FAD synthetase [Nitrosophilus alvini]
MSNGSTFSKNEIESLAIGAFNGMHRGHKELFKRLGTKGGILVIESKKADLTPGRYRCEYVEYPCFFCNFDEIKNMEAEEFIEKLKKEFPNLKKIVVGYDFAFGKGRRYTADDLKKMFDGEVEVVDEVKIDGVSVHSKIIRELLKKGDIEEANKLLGHSYKIEGKIVKGQGLGKKKLVATLNLDIDQFLLPKEGVYATLTEIEGRFYPSVTFIGKRETTDGKTAVETHILDHDLKTTPQEAQIVFLKYLRQNRKFKNLEELKKSIEEDIEEAREVVKEHII